MTPFESQAAIFLSSFEDMIAEFNKWKIEQVLIEEKLDGERIQIHYSKN